ncbi:hypothetical protein Fmac_002505 [Flemingia macrophylla]|uniref:Reverse transcriptase n=1 Tax=Flemingia macrophylla TaxID=520843 RepID=A0ABD1NK55_9FABA
MCVNNKNIAKYLFSEVMNLTTWDQKVQPKMCSLPNSVLRCVLIYACGLLKFGDYHQMH